MSFFANTSSSLQNYVHATCDKYVCRICTKIFFLLTVDTFNRKTSCVSESFITTQIKMQKLFDKLIEKSTGHKSEANICTESSSELFSNSNTRIVLSLLLVPDSIDTTIDELINSHAFPPEQVYEDISSSKFPPSITASMQRRREIITKASRFVRDIDKIAKVCSILLKSRAYHQYNSSKNSQFSDSASSTRSITNLPITKFGKPYIPDAGENIFNISHQHPFVGKVQILGDGKDNFSDVHIGLDLVVDEENKRETLLKYLRSSFTNWEWEQVSSLNTEKEQCREILLRWSMKEAYSKALGLGLQIDFSLLEIILEGIEDYIHDEIYGEKRKSSRWDQVVQKNQQGSTVRACVKLYRKSSQTSGRKEIEKKEFWNFSFFDPVHLCTTNSQEDIDSIPSSCACVCIGPVMTPSKIKNFDVPIEVETLSFSDLLQWHKSDEFCS